MLFLNKELSVQLPSQTKLPAGNLAPRQCPPMAIAPRTTPSYNKWPSDNNPQAIPRYSYPHDSSVIFSILVESF